MEKIRRVTLYILGLSIPIFFLPQIFVDVFGLAKLLLLAGGVVILFCLWGLQIYKSNTLHWRSSPLDAPIVIFGGAHLISLLIASPNKFASLTSPQGAGLIFLLILFYFLALQTAKEKSADTTITLNGLVHAGLILSLWTTFNFLLELTNIKFSIGAFQFPAVNLSLTGNLLTQGLLLLILLIYKEGHFLLAKSQQKTKTSNSFSSLITLALLIFGLTATIYKFLALQPIPLLPYRFGWSIALDAFKNMPVFGVGSANFISAFTRFKPITINATDYWNINFGSSSNWYLHLLTTTGILGLASYLFLIWKVWQEKDKAQKTNKVLWTVMISIFLLQLIAPFSQPILFAEFAFLTVLNTQASLETLPLYKISLFKKEKKP